MYSLTFIKYRLFHPCPYVTLKFHSGGGEGWKLTFFFIHLSQPPSPDLTPRSRQRKSSLQGAGIFLEKQITLWIFFILRKKQISKQNVPT